jgi:hypothetical protein
MKYYIVYFDTNYNYDTTKGYYVSYTNYNGDIYSDNFVFAKRYKTLGPALNRIGLKYNASNAVKCISSLEKGERIFYGGRRIEVVNIPSERKRKLSRLNGSNSDPIKNLGEISTDELIQYLRKNADRFLKSSDGKYFQMSDTVTATKEYIDDWCLHMDNVLNIQTEK